jgi:predicted nucleic acid-binding protein
VVVDTSAVIAVVLNEPEKDRLVELTVGTDLVAPQSLHWEVGNAFSAMFKRGRLGIREASKAVQEYRKIPIQLIEVDLVDALKLSEKRGLYAYDAYFVICAQTYNAPLLTLDRTLASVAAESKVTVLEV